MTQKLHPRERAQLDKIDEFCSERNPYLYSARADQLFMAAMKQNIEWHQQRSEFYRKFLEYHNFSFEQLDDISDLEKIPFVPASFFKKYEVLSIPKSEVYLHLTSSGTTGQKSQIFFDEWTIKVAQRMVDDIFSFYKWVSPETTCNYLLFTYAPKENSKLGTAYTDNFLCKYAPGKEVFYALKHFTGDDFRFDVFGTVEKLQKYSDAGLPVRIFGFPAFLFFTLQYMKEKKIAMTLHPDSLVFLGGGWKGNQDKAISKNELYALTSELLGIPDHRLRDGFGSVEHCVPYIECKHHNFHVPTWSRICIRDVKTLQVLPHGQVGYLQLISPYITSMPANSVLMGDLAKSFAGDSCGCGISNPYFEVIGRAGTSKNKSCAIAASELLKDWERKT